MPRTTPAGTANPHRVIAALAAATLGVLGALLPVTAASAAGMASGRVIDQVGAPVDGVELQIICYDAVAQASVEIERIDTDSNGQFQTTTLPDGSCQAYLYEGEADDFGQYVSTALEFFTVAGNSVVLPDMVVKRYVPVTGTIANWTPEMGAVTVSLLEETLNGWDLVNNTPRPNYFTSTGSTFTLYSPLDAVNYTINFQIESETSPYLDAYLGGFDEPADATSFVGVPNVGVSGLSTTMPDAASITGRVTSGGVPLAGIEVDADNDDGYASGYTDANGYYTLYVPPGTDYSVYAYGDTNHEGEYYYTGTDPCGCEYDPVTATLVAPAEGIDFDLRYELATVDIQAVALEDQQFEPIDRIKIHLYLASGDGWVFAGRETVDVDDLPIVEFSDVAQGRYRLQFVIGTRILSVTDGGVYGSVSTPFDPLPACFADLGDVNESLSAVAVLDAATPSGECAALPAPTVVTPPPTGDTGTTTTGPRRPAASVASALPAATPTPTPTPSSSATPRPSSSPTPTATAPDVPAPASSPDLWWLLWVGLGILVIVVIGGVVYFVRRP